MKKNAEYFGHYEFPVLESWERGRGISLKKLYDTALKCM